MVFRCVFFFFNQKTAYEMRISDWSSDVCSSDLNMRTLHFIKNEEKRRRIARETMDIYAPLAERIGMYEFMTEMQTLSFRELEPDAYASISRRLEQLHSGGEDLIERIGKGLKAHLEANGVDAQVQGREKHPYSIWRKMAERHVSFEQLSDIMAFLAVVDRF